MTHLHPILAGLVATIFGSLAGGLVLNTIWLSGEEITAAKIIGGTLAVTIYGSLLAIPFTFLFGMPIYALLKRLGYANLFTAALFGAVPGVAWVNFTHSSWLDPALFNGISIALTYHVLRQRRAGP